MVALINWDTAGWYPEYREYTLSFTYFSCDNNWLEKVEGILDPYMREAVLMRMIGHDLDL